eukprot:462373_1
MFQPNRTFQAGLNQREARRQRERNSLSLRRKDRELKLQNKRKKVLNKNNRISNQISPGNTARNSYDSILKNLSFYVNGCYNSNPVYIYESLRQIRHLLSLSTSNPPIKQVIDSGCIPRIIQLLTDNNYANIQFEATWILANISSLNTNPEYVSTCIRHDALPFIFNILKIQKYPLQEVAAFALGNIAGESRELRNMIIRNNILPLLINICKTPFNDSLYWCSTNVGDGGKAQYLVLLNTISWTISNLCRGNNSINLDDNYILLMVECTYFLLQCTNQFPIEERTEINMNIGWSYTYLTNGSEFAIEYPNKLLNYMNKYNIIKQLINILNGPINLQIFKPIIKCIGSILSGHDKYTQICVDYGILKIYNRLLKILINKTDSLSLQILKEICWSISNINACHNINIIKYVQNENIFPILCNLLMKPNTISNECLWALANAIEGVVNENYYYNFINYLCDENKCNFMKYLCHYNKQYFQNRNYENNMEKLLIISIECIEYILINDKKCLLFEQYGGIDFLEYMQTVDNISENIYDRIVKIIKRHFDANSDENYYINGVSFNDNNNDNRQLDGERFSFGCNSNGNDRFEF